MGPALLVPRASINWLKSSGLQSCQRLDILFPPRILFFQASSDQPGLAQQECQFINKVSNGQASLVEMALKAQGDHTGTCEVRAAGVNPWILTITNQRLGRPENGRPYKDSVFDAATVSKWPARRRLND